MMRWLLVALCLLASAHAVSAAGRIEPGVSVGPVRAGVTEAELRALMPEGQAERAIWHLGEGIGLCATKLYAGTPDEIFVQWADSPEYDLSEPDAEARCQAEPDRMKASQVTIVLAGDNAGVWTTAQGIGVGMGVIDLSKALGGPVTILACPCDFGGYVRDEAELMDDMIDLWVDFPPDTYLTLPDAVKVELDYELSSSDIPPAMAGDFTIREIAVGLGRSD